MPKYVKKPVVIEAIKWEGQQELEALPVWIQEAIENQTVWFGLNSRNDTTPVMLVDNPDGIHKAQVGDYIVREANGELYPYKPCEFDDTYEEVLDSEEAAEIGKLIQEGIEQGIKEQSTKKTNTRKKSKA
ncbi:hypothetical protein [Intestinibacter sp.]|uniref:hypothetical protein n=1 Tax=Intestinibacter sp. TaxID=1965304 RepID=UPI002A75FEBD|nr:hypothetical protein [Intestinibacter sp.]MDY2735948.1 hypothetical protein [Intestinibacter sp.]